MFFAFAYRWSARSKPGPVRRDGDGTMQQDLFFSYTTMMTIGFGNLVPGSSVGQSMAVAEGLMGTLFLSLPSPRRWGRGGRGRRPGAE